MSHFRDKINSNMRLGKAIALGRKFKTTKQELQDIVAKSDCPITRLPAGKYFTNNKETKING